MRRFVEEADRGQWMLLPECLDDSLTEQPFESSTRLSKRSIGGDELPCSVGGERRAVLIQLAAMLNPVLWT